MIFDFDLKLYYFESVGDNKYPITVITRNIILVTNDSKENNIDGPINIDTSWAEFYLETLNNTRINPDPPSI